MGFDLTGGDLNRQQFCAALSISESTVRRMELEGLPYTPVGARGKRYNLDECKQWLREFMLPPSSREAISPKDDFAVMCSEGKLRAKLHKQVMDANAKQRARENELRKASEEVRKLSNKMKLRVYPSRGPNRK